MSDNLKINNITLGEFLQLSDADALPYRVLFAQKPKDLLAGKAVDFMNWPYSAVAYALKCTRKGVIATEQLIAIFCDGMRITREELLAVPLVEYAAAKRHFNNCIKEAAKREQALAAVSSSLINTANWKTAGGDKLEPFDTVLTLDSLASRYGVWPFDVGKKPYAEVFALLMALATRAKVEREYHTLNKN